MKGLKNIWVESTLVKNELWLLGSFIYTFLSQINSLSNAMFSPGHSPPPPQHHLLNLMWAEVETELEDHVCRVGLPLTSHSARYPIGLSPNSPRHHRLRPSSSALLLKYYTSRDLGWRNLSHQSRTSKTVLFIVVIV